jgi:hypothetical protein
MEYTCSECQPDQSGLLLEYRWWPNLSLPELAPCFLTEPELGWLSQTDNVGEIEIAQ